MKPREFLSRVPAHGAKLMALLRIAADGLSARVVAGALRGVAAGKSI